MTDPLFMGPAQEEVDAAMRDMEGRVRAEVAARYAGQVSLLALEELWGVKTDAEQRLGDLVVRLRRQGVSWASIGRATGVTGQGAMRRWVALVDADVAATAGRPR